MRLITKIICNAMLFALFTGCSSYTQPTPPQMKSKSIPNVSPAQVPEHAHYDLKGYQLQAMQDESQCIKSLYPEPRSTYRSNGFPKAVSLQNRSDVRGIYMSAYAAQGERLSKLIQLIDTTELNAVVLDVKDDRGRVTYDSSVLLANEVGTDSQKLIPNISALLRQLKQKEIYTIARIVAFKDPILAMKKPQLAIKQKNGTLWRSNKGVPWVDPYQTEVQQYNIDLAVEAAKLGFDEIQFDYVRFPENGKSLDREVVWSKNGQSKEQVIEHFLLQAKNSLHALGKPVSADVFGLTTTLPNDMGIGQNWKRIAHAVDFISPMIYPSHYGSGHYGIDNPYRQPYALVANAAKDAIEKNTALSKKGSPTAQIRPWLQDFTAKWVKPVYPYGNREVQEQIKALKERGIQQYLLWNSGCAYTFK